MDWETVDVEKAMIKHLKEHRIGYWKHWCRAMKCSLALFVHAFIPDLLKDYTSKELDIKWSN